MIGQTGSGKSSFINALANYLYEIDFSDPFRMAFIDAFSVKKSQVHSQTSEVQEYVFKGNSFAPPLRIIDTPGLADTGGLEQDKCNFKAIQEFLDKKVGD